MTLKLYLRMFIKAPVALTQPPKNTAVEPLKLETFRLTYKQYLFCRNFFQICEVHSKSVTSLKHLELHEKVCHQDLGFRVTALVA